MFKCAMRFFARSLAIVCLLAGFAILQAVPVAAQTLSFSKAFSPATVETGGTSKLTYTIDNTANNIAVGSLAFMDFLSSLNVGPVPSLAGCGTPSVQTRNSFGTGRVTVSGGTVAAGGICTISFNVRPSRTGRLTSTSRELTSDLPGTGPRASATLTVVPPGTPIEPEEPEEPEPEPETLVFSKVFSPATVETGGTSKLTYKIDNTANDIAVGSLAFVDFLSSLNVVPGPVVGCGTPSVQTRNQFGTVRVTVSGGTVAAGGTCTISFNVRPSRTGRLTSTSRELTSDLPGTGPRASATLTVVPPGTPIEPEEPEPEPEPEPETLVFSKVFSPATVDPGDISRLTYKIDNTANAIAVGSLAFRDFLPSGMLVHLSNANLLNTCGDGSGASANNQFARGRVFLSEGTVAAGGTCTISVTVQALRSGRLTSTSRELTSDRPDATPGASATLTVNEAPLSVSMAFEPTAIGVGMVSRLSYELRNNAAAEARLVSLSDTLPANVVLADPPDAQTTCTEGTLTAPAGGSEVSWSGGSLAAFTVCTIAVDVTSAAAGSHRNDRVSATSTLGASTPNEATLTVTTTEPPLSVSMAFSPTEIRVGMVSRLSYELRNVASVVATGVSLSDTLPADVVLTDTPNAETTCAGGTLAAAAGDGDVSWSGGSLAAGAACTIAVDVTSAAVGSHRNDRVSVTSSLGASSPVEATLMVTDTEPPLLVSMSFEPSTIDQGGVSRLTYELRNDATVEAERVTLSDTLPQHVLVAAKPDINVRSCSVRGGAVRLLPGGNQIFWGALAHPAGETCTIAVNVTSTVAGSYPNRTEEVRSSLGTSTPAEAMLTVTAADAPGFAKAFSPATVDPGGVSRLTFTIDNATNLIDVGGLAFDDDFPDGLAVAATPNASTTCGGTFAPAASATALAFTGGLVGAGQSCTLSVDVQALQIGTLTGTSGDLTSNLPVATPGASATLTVNTVPLSVSMAFEPTLIKAGGVSRLTYGLDNGAAVDATSVSLSDTLPTRVVVANPPNLQTTCTFNVGSAGGPGVSYSGGTLGAGASCMIAVDVTSGAAGSYRNDTESVISSLGTSAPAEATLTVDAADAPGFARVFSPATIRQGGETAIVFTVDNGANAIAMTEMAFDAPLPSGVSVADTPGAVNGCGGTFSPVAGATTLAFTGGELAAGAACEIRVTVRAIEAGTLTGPAVELTSSIATATALEATLTVDAAAPGFSKAFSPPTVDAGDISRLTFTIDNTANLIDVVGLTFEDDFPNDLALAEPTNRRNSCGGALLDVALAPFVRLSGGTVAAGQTCTISVDVRASRAGTLENVSGDLTSNLPVDAPGASATLTVNEAPLSVSMSFSPSTIDQGGVSRLTYELRNDTSVEAERVTLSDTLPADVVVAGPPDTSATCGNDTLTAPAGGNEVSYFGFLRAGAVCTITVDVTSTVAGSYPNSTERATSLLGTSTPAEATLTVTAADAPGFAKAFSPATVDPGGVSRLTFTIDNAANLIDVDGLAFDDDFPAGLAVAATPNGSTTCGGTFAPAASATALAFTGGRVAAGQSCTLSVDVQALQIGALTGTSGDLTSNLPVATPGASATLTVNEAPLSVSMSFSPTTVDQAGVTRLIYLLHNGASFPATSVSLSDTLPTDVVLADPPNLRTTCTGGTLTAPAGGSEVSWSGGSLAAGAGCPIAVDVTSTVAGSYPNSTERATSSLGTSTPAEATLTVEPADAPVFAKRFSPATVDPGEVSRLTYTINNSANLIEVGSLAFRDFLPSGMLVHLSNADLLNTCGDGSRASASNQFATGRVFLSEGTVAAGGTCTISVTVQALRSGTLTGTSGELASDLPVDAPGASATLTVNEAPLSVSMAFSPAMIGQGGVSRLTYGLDNGAAVGATSVALSDMLPEDVVLASDPDASTTCTGGTLTAQGGGNTITFTGGALDAGATCTITVDVTSAAVGSYRNDTQSVTSSLGTSTLAEAMLTVAPAVAPGFAKTFSPATVAPGGVSRLTFTVDNTANLIDVGGLAFDDNFPDGLAVASTPNAATTCGGTFAPAEAATSLAFSGGSVAAGQSCTLSVDVQALQAGALTGTSGDLTSDLPDATPGASATLTVNEAPLSVSMSFSPSTIDPGGVSRLTYRLGNGALIPATSVSLSDTLPTGVVLASEPNAQSGCVGTLTAPTGGSEVSWSGGLVEANESCTITVDVTSAAAGSYRNATDSVTSSLGASTPAEAMLTVTAADAPGFAKTFSPATVDPGGISRLTFTIDNAANLIDVGGLAFDDDFPAGLAVAATSNASTTCGGTFAPAASATSLAFTGGSVAAGQSCTLSVDVQALQAGTLTGTSGDLTSDLPVTAPGASATLTVNEAPLSVSVAFSPSTIDQGGVSRLSYGLDNGAAVGATSVSLSDTLPGDVVLADPPNAETTCADGTLTAPAGGGEVSWSGGALDAGASCTIAVDVTSAAAGSYRNDTQSVTSSLGASAPAEATLTVDAAGALGFAKTFSPPTVDPGGVSRLSFTIDNVANAIAVGSLAFDDAFPDGMVVAATPNADNSCGGTFAPVASATALAFTGGSVAAGQSCTLSVDVEALQAGTLTGTSSDLTSDLPVAAPGVSATLTVNETPLSVSMTFSPATVDQGDVSRLSYGLDNGAAVAAMSVALSDTLPGDVVLASDPDAQTTCTGGTLTAQGGGNTITFTGGGLDAGAGCTIAVDVTSAVAGSYRNTTDSVTSSLGASAPAEATLTVDAVVAPGFARVFSPDTIRQGGETQVVFTIDNGANAIAMTGMAFDDSLPSGVSVADTPAAGNSCGGTFNPVAGATTLGFSDGALAAGAACEIRVTVRAIEAGTLTGPAVDLTSSIATARAAEATLTVDAAAALGFAKAFSPATVDPGGVSRLTYTIDNTANAIEVGSLAFRDFLPSGLLVAVPANTSLVGCGNPRLQTSNQSARGRVLLSRGTIAAGGTCTISLDVQPTRSGPLTGTSGGLSSDLPVVASGASATLTVNEAPLSVSMSFSPSTIDQGGVSRLTYGLDNGTSVAARSVSLSDTLPAGVVLADPPNARKTCPGGRLTAAAGGGEVSWSGGLIVAGTTCTIAVDVTSAAAGSYRNDTQSVTSSLGASAPAEATLTVDAAAAPGFAKVFSPATVAPGGVSRLTYTIDNTANTIEVGSLAFRDFLPSGLLVAVPANTSLVGCGNPRLQTSNQSARGRVLFSRGTIAAGGTCTISLDVQPTRSGALTGTSGNLSSDLSVAVSGASATLTVNDAPLSVSMSFSPSTIDQGGVSRLTYGLDNGAAVAARSVSLSDTLPAGVVLADPPNVRRTCPGGRLTAAADGGEVSWSGGLIVAGASCTIAVDVTSAAAGSYRNDTQSVTSSLGASAPASATLTVDAAAALGFAKAFSPATVAPGGLSRLTYMIDNSANDIEVGSLAFRDFLPFGVLVAVPANTSLVGCGNPRLRTSNNQSARGRVLLSRGTVAAGGTCTISLDVRPTRSGTLTGTSGNLTSDLSVAVSGASATLTVNEALLSVSMSFEPSTIDPGGVSRLSYGLDNGAAVDARSVSLSDTLPAGVVLADPPNARKTCPGGRLTAAAGSGEVSWSGGLIVAGASCTIAVDVTSAAAGSYRNATQSVISSLGASAPAEATLTVDAATVTPAEAPGFAKAFSPATVDPGGVSRLTYTIDNTANAIEVGSLAFRDFLPSGLLVAVPANTSLVGCGNPRLQTSNQSARGRVLLSRGTVAAGGTCTISLDVRPTRSGPLTGTSGNLTSDLSVATSGASATLTVNEAPLSVSMAFSPSTINPGGVSRLTYGLDNGTSVEARLVSLSDTLPAGVVLADPPNVRRTCPGGRLTAAAGGGEVSWSGGLIVAGASCTIAVDVTSAAAGSYRNDTQSVTSSLGASAPAEATLTVDAAAAPGFAKAFSPATVAPGGVSRLTYTIDNTANTIEVGSLTFRDFLPSGLLVAVPANTSLVGCGNPRLQTSNQSARGRVLFSRGTIAAGGTCTISLDVQPTRSGPLTGTSGNLSSDLSVAASGASATLTVNDAPLSVSMEFSPSTIDQSGVSRLTYGLDNGTSVAARSVSLSDTLPAGVVLADPPNVRRTCPGGRLTAAAGGGEVSWSGGLIVAGASCMIAVDVTSAAAGSYRNDTQSVTSSLGASAPAEATLTVDAAAAPGFAKAFSPATVDPGGVSRLTYTIDNTANTIEVGSLAFRDFLPSGLLVAVPANTSLVGCGNPRLQTSNQSARGRVLFSRGTIAAGGTCTISLDVQPTRSGTLTGTSGNLSSDLSVAVSGASATLTVNEAPLSVSMEFSPSTIDQGGVSRLTYGLDNGVAVAARSVSLSDTLPAGVVLADPPNVRRTCPGGRLTAAAGGGEVSWSGGLIVAGASCTIAVDVTSAAAGSYPNATQSVTSSLGASARAEATLTVDAAAGFAAATLTVDTAVAPGFAKVFSPATVDPGGVSTLSFTIDNAANAIAVGSLAFDDAFPEGLAVAPEPNADNSCGGAFAPAASATSLAFSGGLVAAGGTCTLSVDVQALQVGTLTGTSGDLSSDLSVAVSGASATLTVNDAPLSVSLAFSPATVDQGGVSRLSYGLDNGAAVEARSVSLSDTLPGDVVLADPPNAQTTCSGGTLTAQGGGNTFTITGGTLMAQAGGNTFTFTGGALDAGASCTVAVDVTSAVAGSYPNATQSVTSSLGASAPAEATLTVTQAGAPLTVAQAGAPGRGQVTFNVASDTDGIFRFSSAEPALTTSLEVNGGTGSTGMLPVATGSHSVAVAAPTGVALTAIACDDTDSTADVSAATVSVTLDASEDVTCTLTAQSSVQRTVETINSFLTRRADLILSSEPNPGRRFDRLKRGLDQTRSVRLSNWDIQALLPFTVKGGDGDYAFSTSLPQVSHAAASAELLTLGAEGEVTYVENNRFDAWFEAQYRDFGDGADGRGDFTIAYAGVDYLLTPDVLVGALGSFDRMEESTSTGKVSGSGYMFGPYTTARLTPNLYFDGRFAIGRSYNEISPFKTYTDSFQTGRWLAMASLTGEVQYDNWTIRPHTSLSYLEETQKGYVDSVGATIPSQTIRLGQFKVGPTFTREFTGPEGRNYSFYLTADAIYNTDDTTGVTLSDTNGEVGGWRARLKSGVGMTTDDGTRLSFGATHDGIGQSDFESWGLTFELSIPLH